MNNDLNIFSMQFSNPSNLISVYVMIVMLSTNKNTQQYFGRSEICPVPAVRLGRRCRRRCRAVAPRRREVVKVVEQRDALQTLQLLRERTDMSILAKNVIDIDTEGHS